MTETKAILRGPSHPPLCSCTMAEILQHQANEIPDNDAVVAFSTNTRRTYYDVNLRTRDLARAMLAVGIRKGDKIALLLGNCAAFVELFLATARIGAIAVLIQGPYSTSEVVNVLQASESSMLFLSALPNNEASVAFLNHFSGPEGNVNLWQQIPNLNTVVQVSDGEIAAVDDGAYTFLTPWKIFLQWSSLVNLSHLTDIEDDVIQEDVCAFFLTSGTTGNPKIAMLTHSSIINNGILCGDRISLTPDDRICCCFPLFHCAGLICGMMACLVHGASLIFPADQFSATATLKCLRQEQCTGLHGVPTMFNAILQKSRVGAKHPSPRLRTGIIGGSFPSESLWMSLQREFGLENLAEAFGMTETSAAVFMSSPGPGGGRTLPGQLQILPHTSAKVVDRHGKIVARGERGELCVAGYLLQKGYYKNQEKTQETMIYEDGDLWLRTGDEVLIDTQGNMEIIGRIKDIIIRGGENIYPQEIEDRLEHHNSIAQACVVGLTDDHYGQVVAAFLQQAYQTARPSDREIAAWVRLTLGPVKVPTRIFWLGTGDLPQTFPLTGSGKIRKNVLQANGQQGSRRQIA